MVPRAGRSTDAGDGAVHPVLRRRQMGSDLGRRRSRLLLTLRQLLAACIERHAYVFDVLTIAAIADELTGAILDGRIQRVGLIDRRTIGAEVFANGRRRTLIMSADDRDPRIYL